MSKQASSGERWRIVKKIAHNPEASIVAFIALIAQVRHAQHVFYVGGHEHNGSGLFSSWAYALAVESATLFFVLQGWVPVSWAFAIGSMVLNVAYYTIALTPEYGPLAMVSVEYLPFTWWRWLLAIFLPVTIASFSHAVEASSDEMASAPRAASKPVASGERGNLRKWASGKWASAMAMVSGEQGAGQVASEPVASVASKPVASAASDVLAGQVARQVVSVVSDGELTDEHVQVLEYLASVDKPVSKSDIMRATGHHYNKLERKRDGELTGLLTDLVNGGQVVRDGKHFVVSGEGAGGTLVSIEKASTIEVHTNGKREMSYAGEQ